MKFYFVSRFDIERFNSNALGSTSEDAPELKGIKGAHSFYFHGGRIVMKPYSLSSSEAAITTSPTNSIECNSESLPKKAIEINDCVKIICERYEGCCATIISKYDSDKWEIQYFKKSFDKCVLKVGDFN